MKNDEESTEAVFLDGEGGQEYRFIWVLLVECIGNRCQLKVFYTIQCGFYVYSVAVLLYLGYWAEGLECRDVPPHCDNWADCIFLYHWVGLSFWHHPYLSKSLKSAKDIYLWSQVVCLFCFTCTYGIHWTGILQIAFLVSLESSQGEGVHGLGSMSVWTCGAKVLEYWMISSLKIKLHCRMKISVELECAFGVVGKILMSRI